MHLIRIYKLCTDTNTMPATVTGSSVVVSQSAYTADERRTDDEEDIALRAAAHTHTTHSPTQPHKLASARAVSQSTSQVFPVTGEYHY